MCELDPARNVATLRDGGEMPYDLFLGVPVHRAPRVVVDSGMTENGWIAVNPLTLETSFERVYALGDVAAVGTPRAGVFAEGHAAVAAQRIADEINGNGSAAEYGGPRHLLPGVRLQPDRRPSTLRSSAINGLGRSSVRPRS